MARSSSHRVTPRASKREQKRNQEETSYEPDAYYEPKKEINTSLVAQNDNQKRYINAINSSIITVALGPAGTGKTYIAGSVAALRLAKKEIDKVVITRPAIEVGQSLGFLPGELEEKYEPFIEPFKEVMIERLGRTHYEYALKAEKIAPKPLAYMRGATFKNAVVILDEAQNVTPTEMKMFLTRIGKNCTVIINGDLAQSDIRGQSGLEDAVKRISQINGVSVIEFTEDDIVRSGIVKDILLAYRYG